MARWHRLVGAAPLRLAVLAAALVVCVSAGGRAQALPHSVAPVSAPPEETPAGAGVVQGPVVSSAQPSPVPTGAVYQPAPRVAIPAAPASSTGSGTSSSTTSKTTPSTTSNTGSSASSNTSTTASNSQAATPSTPPAVVAYTSADLDLIAQVIRGEANGQPVNARLGVAAVIVNRVRSGEFGASIEDVVDAPGQFQSVGSPLFELPPLASNEQLALEAVHGSDPTGGALYFYNPAMTPPSDWIGSLDVLITIGQLTFAR